VVQAFTGLAAPADAAPEGCAAPEQLFAVDGGTGHLSELEACESPASIAVVGVVDRGDWRSADRVFAAGSGAVTVVYAVTGDGRLEARRQDAPGADLGPPVQVGAGIDWARFRAIIVPGPGYLVADDGAVRTFRHVDWAAGGSAVVEGPPLLARPGDFPDLGELLLTGLGAGGHAEAFFAGSHWRIWRRGGQPIAYPNGAIPADVRLFVTGSEPALYGVTDGGAVVRLRHQPHPPPAPGRSYICPFNPKPWRAASSLPGGWSAVVVPRRAAATGEWPAVAAFPTWPDPSTWTCPDGVGPYKWQ
jgi:hypothetical protein